MDAPGRPRGRLPTGRAGLATDRGNSVRPPGPRLPARERRRQLLDVALEAFAANGFHVTSMDDIAKSAGVSRQTVFSAFGSKANLLKEAFDEVVQFVREQLLPGDGPGFLRLAELVAELFDQIALQGQPVHARQAVP